MNKPFREALNQTMKAMMWDMRTAWLRPEEWAERMREMGWTNQIDLDQKPWYGTVQLEPQISGGKEVLIKFVITIESDGEEVTVAEMLRRADA